MYLSRLTQDYDKLTELEKKIVNFIMKNPEKISYLTANEVAKKIYVSKTSIINLCKKLGFDGYSELRYYVKDYIKNKNIKEEKISYDDILINFSDEINKTLSLQDEKNIKSICEKIIDAKVVYIIARGATRPLADLLSSRLAMLKVKSIFINDQNLIDVLGESLVRGEVLLLISLSGETQKIKHIAKVGRSKGIDVIALTSFSNNTLQRIANYRMFCFADEVETKNNDVISRLGLHTLVQILIVYIATKNWNEDREE